MTLSGIDHILLLGDERDATRDFYGRVLGLTVGARPAAPTMEPPV